MHDMRCILDSIEENLEKATRKRQVAAERRARRQIRELISQAKSLRQYTLDRSKVYQYMGINGHRQYD